MTNLLPMDYAALAYLAEHGPLPLIAIPDRLFRGEIPEGMPSLVELGMIVHRGELTSITTAGLAAISQRRAA